jgi:uncharacterized protein (TIGR02453 family)
MSKRETQERTFKGFPREAFSFLKGLKAHNDKPWFETHRGEYEQHLLQPLRDLVTDLSDFMLGIDLSFEVAPSVGKTISRIYRDTRFSKDKSPLRDCVWIVFKRSNKDWSRWGIAYFLEISATGYRFGLGFYDAAPAVMTEFRKRIDEDPKAFLKAVAWYDKQDTLKLEGETYKRPKSQDKPEPIRTWYNHKSFYLSCSRKLDEAIRTPRLVDDLTAAFAPTAPLYHYLLSTIAAVGKLESRR